MAEPWLARDVVVLENVLFGSVADILIETLTPHGYWFMDMFLVPPGFVGTPPQFNKLILGGVVFVDQINRGSLVAAGINHSRSDWDLN
jgi:hypothetical protein